MKPSFSLESPHYGSSNNLITRSDGNERCTLQLGATGKLQSRGVSFDNDLVGLGI